METTWRQMDDICRMEIKWRNRFQAKFDMKLRYSNAHALDKD